MHAYWIAAIAAAVLALTSSASAQECTQESDCEDPLMFCDFGGDDAASNDSASDLFSDSPGTPDPNVPACTGDDCPVVEIPVGICRVDPLRCSLLLRRGRVRAALPRQ